MDPGGYQNGLLMSEGRPVNLVDLPEVLVNSTTRKNGKKVEKTLKNAIFECNSAPVLGDTNPIFIC